MPVIFGYSWIEWYMFLKLWTCLALHKYISRRTFQRRNSQSEKKIIATDWIRYGFVFPLIKSEDISQIPYNICQHHIWKSISLLFYGSQWTKSMNLHFLTSIEEYKYVKQLMKLIYLESKKDFFILAITQDNIEERHVLIS